MKHPLNLFSPTVSSSFCCLVSRLLDFLDQEIYFLFAQLPSSYLIDSFHVGTVIYRAPLHKQDTLVVVVKPDLHTTVSFVKQCEFASPVLLFAGDSTSRLSINR